MIKMSQRTYESLLGMIPPVTCNTCPEMKHEEDFLSKDWCSSLGSIYPMPMLIKCIKHDITLDKFTCIAGETWNIRIYHYCEDHPVIKLMAKVEQVDD